jgi:hypothetical protein
VFLDFANLESAYGSEEARRQHALENYTAQSLIDIVKSEKLEDTVDLVSAPHVAVFLTDKEVQDARADYAAASAAGVDLSRVEWLDKETMQTASSYDHNESIVCLLSSRRTEHHSLEFDIPDKIFGRLSSSRNSTSLRLCETPLNFCSACTLIHLLRQ